MKDDVRSVTKINEFLKLQADRIVPIVFSLLVMIICYLCFYPGVMTWDSLEQLRQARINEYGNWQPPVMAFLWHQVLWMSDGPGVMLFFHMAMLYLSSVLLFLWSRREEHRWSIMFLFIPFFPWVVNFEYVIWKDVGLAYSWLLATSIAIYFSDRVKFPIAAATAIFLFFIYGALIRANSLFGAVFLLPFLFSCIFKKSSLKFFMLSFACAAAVSTLLPSALSQVLSAIDERPASYVMFDDIAALAVRDSVVVESILQADDISELKTCDSFVQSGVGAAFCINKKFTEVKDDHYQALKQAWVVAVSQNVLSYFNNRLNSFVYFIRSPKQDQYYSSEFRVVASPYLFDSEFQPSTVGANLVMRYVYVAKILMPEIFKPYFWLAVALLITILTNMKKASGYLGPLWMLPFSGFMYAASYFPIVAAADFRYVYWLCLIVTVSTMLWATIFFRAQQTQNSTVVNDRM